jgi:hypothetical protein
MLSMVGFWPIVVCREGLNPQPKAVGKPSHVRERSTANNRVYGKPACRLCSALAG